VEAVTGEVKITQLVMLVTAKIRSSPASTNSALPPPIIITIATIIALVTI
jgi:hypothetical protein